MRRPRPGRPAPTARRAWLRRPAVVLAGAGAAAALCAAGVRPADAAAAASQDWPPFVLVAGLLMVGLVADADGLFAAAGAVLARVARHDAVLLGGTVVLVSAVTAVLNLDTSVAFLTPVLVYSAARTRPGGTVLVAGALLLSNAASLLLPGANLTNLIVLGHGHIAGGQYLGDVWPAWAAAVAVTTAAIGVGMVLAPRRPRRDRVGPGAPPGPPAAAPEAAASTAAAGGQVRGSARLGAGALAIAAVTGLVLVLRSPALPVLAVGAAVAGAAVARRRLSATGVVSAVGPAVLVGLFGIAVALGTAGRAWDGTAVLLGHLGRAATAAVAAGASVAVNNLPAASLLGAHAVPHPFALLVGLDVGPNLFVTGSLSWVLWMRAARHAGDTPPVRTAVVVGALSTPLAVAAAVAALALAGR